MDIGEDFKILTKAEPRSAPVSVADRRKRLDFYRGKPNRFLIVYDIAPGERIVAKPHNSVADSLDAVFPTAKESQMFVSGLSKSTRDLRSFIVEDIAPIVLSSRQGWEEAQVVLRELTGAEDLDLNSDEKTFSRILQLAVNIKMASKISSTVDLDPQDTRLLYALAFNPPQKPTPDDMSKLTSLFQQLVNNANQQQPSNATGTRSDKSDSYPVENPFGLTSH